MSPEEALEAVATLAAPQWRAIPPSVVDIDDTFDAWRDGRNWMIDRIREVLEDVDREPDSSAA